MRRAKGIRAVGYGGDLFSPIPLQITEGKDLAYGSTGTHLLSEIDSRHKLLWLWGMVYSAISKLGLDCPLIYHAALQMIDDRGFALDKLKGTKDWVALVRGWRWSRGIYLPGERLDDEDKFQVVCWEGEVEAEPPLLVFPVDFALTARDRLACDSGDAPGMIDMLHEAMRQDDAGAEQLRNDVDRLGWKPVR